MKVINSCSDTIRGVPGGAVMWINWKEFLRQIYTYPSALKMNSYFVFKFSDMHPGEVLPRKGSRSS